MSDHLTLPHRLWRLLPSNQRRRLLGWAASIAAPGIADAPPNVRDGIILAGEFSRASGLGESARLFFTALEKLGVPVWPLDIGPLLPAHSSDVPPPAGRESAPPPDAALVLHVNPPLLPLVLTRLPRGLVKGRRIVGIWAWELPVPPPGWQSGARFVHDVWAISGFTAEALAPLVPGRIRTVTLPLAAAPLVPSRLGRADFGLPDDTVTVLTSFNLASSFERKNPLAAIAAFRSAFGDRGDRLLVMKVSYPDHYPDDYARIAAAIGGAPNIRLETRNFSREDTLALTEAADIVLSPHRSEGFGLVPAEAMLLAKPVIATGWSGNMDFMDETSAALVRYTLIPARDPRGTYDIPDALWADPDIAHAAEWLRRLADDKSLRQTMGAAGQSMARSRLGTDGLAAAVRALGGGLLV